MPKDPQAGPLRHHEVRLLLDFSTTLLKQLADPHDAIRTDVILISVDEKTKLAAQLPQRTQIKRLFSHDLSTTARNVWNLCVRLPTDEDPKCQVLRLRCRQFAFALMHLAKWPGPSSAGTKFNDLAVLLTMLFKICQVAMNMGETGAAADAMTKAAQCVSLLLEIKPGLDVEQSEECKQLEVRNLCLRTALAWKENRLEVAEAMFARTEGLRRSLDPEAAEEFAEVLCDMGKGLAGRGVFESAVTWLRRALGVLEAQNVEMMSTGACHLRDAACQALVTAMLETGEEGDWEAAKDAVATLEDRLGEKPVVLALRLEVLAAAKAEQFDAKAYADGILRLSRTLSGSAEHVGMVQQNISVLHSRDPTMGCKTMDQWLLKNSGVVTSEDLDSMVLQRVAMATKQQGVTQTIFDLLKLLDGLMERGTKALGGTTAFHVQALIWKKIEGLALQAADRVAPMTEGWCRIACHGLFEGAGPVNLSILRRKLVQCALDAGDIDMARRALQAMSTDAQDEPLTRYLVFKLCLITSDQQLALECLNIISKNTQAPDLLYACAMQAQAHADKVLACHTMLALIDNLDATDKACSPALLRSALRLLGQQLKEHQHSEKKDENTTQICAVLNRAVEEIERCPLDKEGMPLYTIHELEYFSKTCLNLVVKYREILQLVHVLQISQICIDINGKYPANVSEDVAGDTCLRSMWCHFMAACAMMALARCEKEREKRFQTYQDLRHHVAAYCEAMRGRAESFEGPLREDLQGKCAHLLLFDLEAAVHLLDYDALQGIIQRAVACKDGEVMKAMADCLLRGEVKPEYLYPAMKEVINGLWDIHGFKFASLAKFVRCLFQALLPVDAGMCEELLGIAIEMAKEPTDVEVSFPRDEVEWLVVKAWNQACDFRAGSRQADSERWAVLAFTLARYLPDEGRLEAQVQAAWDIIKKQDGGEGVA